MPTFRCGLRDGARAVLGAALAILAGCGAATGVSAPAAGGPLALQAGEHLEMVSGAQPIDRSAAQTFRRMRLERGPWQTSRSQPASAAMHGFWAIWPRNDTGVQAEQVIWPNLVVKEASTTIYAPTLYAAAGACIESTTAYHASPRGLQIWAYDWCAKGYYGRIGLSLRVDAAFLRTYTRPAGRARSYLVRVEQTDSATNEWTDYLYNFATAKWNVFYRTHGTVDGDIAGIPAGWDAYESYSSINRKTRTSDMCGEVGAVGPIVSEELHLLTPSGWHLADQANSYIGMDGDSFHCPLNFSVPKANYKYSVSRR
jgi:hypothetical protein